jgi:hypothetical protein
MNKAKDKRKAAREAAEAREDASDLRAGERHLGYGKNINMTLADEATFEKWKGADGTAHHAVATEGVRLV